MNRRYYIVFFLVMFLTSFTNAQITVNFNADTTVVCEDVPLQFNDLSSGYNVFKWHWNFGDTITDTVQNPIHVYSEPGVYAVTLTAYSKYSPDSLTPPDTSVGTRVKTNYIYVRSMPVLDYIYTDTMFLPSFLYYFDGTVTNMDTLPYHYYWNFDETSFVAGDTIAVHTFPKESGYEVSFLVVAGLGCIDTVTKTINTKDVVEAPNIFSPNGDGQNDVFVVKTNGSDIFVLDIFNRWGAIVYSLSAKRLQWDGRSSAGVILPPGTYYYLITSPEESNFNKSGVLLLVK